jgi:hypothetical protein
MAPFLSSFPVLLIFIAFFSPSLFEGGISFKERAESPTQQDTHAHINACTCVRERVCVQHVCACGHIYWREGGQPFAGVFVFAGAFAADLAFAVIGKGTAWASTSYSRNANEQIREM